MQPEIASRDGDSAESADQCLQNQAACTGIKIRNHQIHNLHFRMETSPNPVAVCQSVGNMRPGLFRSSPTPNLITAARFHEPRGIQVAFRNPIRLRALLAGPNTQFLALQIFDQKPIDIGRVHPTKLNDTTTCCICADDAIELLCGDFAFMCRLIFRSRNSQRPRQMAQSFNKIFARTRKIETFHQHGVAIDSPPCIPVALNPRRELRREDSVMWRFSKWSPPHWPIVCSDLPT